MLIVMALAFSLS